MYMKFLTMKKLIYKGFKTMKIVCTLYKGFETIKEFMYSGTHDLALYSFTGALFYEFNPRTSLFVLYTVTSHRK